MAATTLHDLIVRFGLDASELQRGIDQAVSRVQSFGAGMKQLGSEVSQVGRTLTATVTLPITAIGVGALKASADWETAMTNVAKTVDAPATEIARLGREIQAMSERVPVSANQLASLASLGAQLGIETENLAEFSETMAAVGATTNLTAEEAADAFAQFANITQTPQANIERLASVVVDLGNKSAATERDIAEFGLRIAGAGEIAGLTESDILGIGAAMASVGIEAEAGGTAVQKVLLAMTEQVNTGGEKLRVFAQTAGLTTSEFARLFREDASEAFRLFVEGLGRQGQDAFATLEQLDLQDQRLIRSFLSLAGAGDLLGQSLDTAGKAWEENTALTAEAERFYATMSNQLQILRNTITNAAAELGLALRPAFEKLLEVVRPAIDFIAALVERFKALDPNVQLVIIAVAALAAAVGPVLVVIGTLVTVVGAVATAVATLAPLIPPVVAGIAAIAAPVAVAVAALGSLATAVVAAYRSSEDFRATVETAFREVVATVSPIIDELRVTVEVVLERVRALWDKHGADIMAVVVPAMKVVVAAIEAGLKLLGTIVLSILNIIQGDWQGFFDNMRSISEISSKALKAIIGGAFEALKNLVVGIVRTMWQQVEDAFREGAARTVGIMERLTPNFLDPWKKMQDELVGHSIIPDMVRAAIGHFTRMEQETKARVTNTANEIVAAFGVSKKAALEWAAEIDETTQALVRQEQTFGMTKRELLAFDLAQMNATATQIEAALRIYDSVAALEAMEQAKKDNAEAVRDLVTELEREAERLGATIGLTVEQRIATLELTKEEMANIAALQEKIRQMEFQNEVQRVVDENNKKIAESEREHARAVEEARERIKNKLADLVDRYLPEWAKGWQDHWNTAKDIFATFGVDLGSLLDGIGGLFDGFLGKIGGWLDDLGGWIGGLFSKTSAAATQAVQTAATAATTIASTTATTIAGLGAGTGTAAAGATGVVGVSGTAGGLTTGAGIPTIGGGGVGTTTSILGGAAGAGIALGGPVALAFGGESLLNALGRDSLQAQYWRGVRQHEDLMAAAREWGYDGTGIAPGFLTGDYSMPALPYDPLSGPQAALYDIPQYDVSVPPTKIVLEVDGRQLGSIAMQYGIDEARLRTGLVEY